jgi:hypothetical protein
MFFTNSSIGAPSFRFINKYSTWFTKCLLYNKLYRIKPEAYILLTNGIQKKLRLGKVLQHLSSLIDLDQT